MRGGWFWMAFGVWLAGASPVLAGGVAETRCGWFENPSPANAWLNDRDGAWLIGEQGGHQAEGNGPSFKDSQWIKLGEGPYGYGCACLTGRFDKQAMRVLSITKAKARPLSACDNDPALKEAK